jgi:hypothetical protein
MSFRSGVANATELGMLRRVLSVVASEMKFEKSSPDYEDLNSHLMILFEATRNEDRLLTLMRRSAAMIGVRSDGRSSRSGRRAKSRASL